ncbi:MAG: cobyrinic acid a,c-diamide synthase, partial [Firmicutes bacterium]|nr:cobyrinic acid a,c-diamide synthase [Bacillota bacterium]
MPRLMIAAPGSETGKTTVMLALLSALMKRGASPVAFKCGPDYVDPLFHRETLG